MTPPAMMPRQHFVDIMGVARARLPAAVKESAPDSNYMVVNGARIVYSPWETPNLLSQSKPLTSTSTLSCIKASCQLVNAKIGISDPHVYDIDWDVVQYRSSVKEMSRCHAGDAKPQSATC